MNLRQKLRLEAEIWLEEILVTMGPDVIETIPLDRLYVQVTVPACIQSVICRFDQLFSLCLGDLHWLCSLKLNMWLWEKSHEKGTENMFLYLWSKFCLFVSAFNLNIIKQIFDAWLRKDKKLGINHDLFFFKDVKLESFWEKQTCVILFMRRFGWPTCRLHIKEVSTIHPRLEANNIRFVGIGVEELGVEDFVKGGFFPGGL